MATYGKFYDYVTKPQTVRFFKSVDVNTEEMFHNIIDFGIDYFNAEPDEDERINAELFTSIIFCRNGGYHKRLVYDFRWQLCCITGTEKV